VDLGFFAPGEPLAEILRCFFGEPLEPEADNAAEGSQRGPASNPMTTSSFQKSRRIYVNGRLNPDVRVSLRQIEQSPTRLRARQARQVRARAGGGDGRVAHEDGAR
jgi:ThiC-associated domain